MNGQVEYDHGKLTGAAAGRIFCYMDWQLLQKEYSD